jgi:hypothetical protein
MRNIEIKLDFVPPAPVFHHSIIPIPHAFDYNKAADRGPGPEDQVLNVRTKSRVV